MSNSHDEDLQHLTINFVNSVSGLIEDGDSIIEVFLDAIVNVTSLLVINAAINVEIGDHPEATLQERVDRILGDATYLIKLGLEDSEIVSNLEEQITLSEEDPEWVGMEIPDNVSPINKKVIH